MSNKIDHLVGKSLLDDGILDMVGMTRAHIADPYIVEKIKTG